MDGNKFQFKQFELEHGNPGLKITTEACLFGAVAANFPAKAVLDIGAGCGLLSAMYAQKNPNAAIKAIEIDYQVAELAQKNCQNSPFKTQINVLWGDIHSFDFSRTFDLIIANPPFFFDHLKSSNPIKNLAMHSSGLNPKKLLEAIDKNLAPDGKAFILYPEKEMKKLIQSAEEKELYLNKWIEIWTKDQGKLLRIIGEFSRFSQPIESQYLPIKNLSNEYSAEFKNYLADYYTIF